MASSTIVLCALGLVSLDMPLCARLDASYLSADLHKLLKEDEQMKMPGGPYYTSVVDIFDNFAAGLDNDGCPADWTRIDTMERCRDTAKDKIPKSIWGKQHGLQMAESTRFVVGKSLAWWPSGCIVNKAEKLVFFNPYDAEGRKSAGHGPLRKKHAINFMAICTKDVALLENWVPTVDNSSGVEYFWNVVTQETRWDAPVTTSGMASAICCANPKKLPRFGKNPGFQEVSRSLGRAFTETLFDVKRHSNPAEACKSVGSKRRVVPTQCCTSSFPAVTIDFLSLREAGILPKDDIAWKKTPMEFWGCYCRILTKCLYIDLRVKDGDPFEPSRLVCDALVAYEAFPANLASEEHVRKYYTEAYKHMFENGYTSTSPVDFCAA